MIIHLFSSYNHSGQCITFLNISFLFSLIFPLYHSDPQDRPLLSLRISSEWGESYGMEESATVNQMYLQQIL